MPMPVNARKENLGQAYVRAVVASVGFNISKDENDFGLDGTIKDVSVRNGRYHNNGINIEYQLKSTSAVTITDDTLIYDLESKNYNDLATWEGPTPAILIVFVMPSEEKEWIGFSQSGLTIRNCAWWYSISGSEPTSNENTKRIRIPLDQVFSPEKLNDLMARVRGGEKL